LTDVKCNEKTQALKLPNKKKLEIAFDNVIEKLEKNLPNLLHEQSPLCPQFLSYEQQLVLLPPAEA